jgi:hypothetical protein
MVTKNGLDHQLLVTIVDQIFSVYPKKLEKAQKNLIIRLTMAIDLTIE